VTRRCLPGVREVLSGDTVVLSNPARTQVPVGCCSTLVGSHRTSGLINECYAVESQGHALLQGPGRVATDDG
jgi:hypothetical protein